MEFRRVLFVVVGAFVGSWAGFALLFYGYLLLHPPGPGGVEFETASPLGFFIGGPLGMALGGILGYRLGKR